MQTINLDITQKGIIPLLYTKQRDVGRKFKAVVTDGGTAYPITDDMQLSVWYSGTSGEGNYSAVGDRSAFTINGNSVTVELITQMLRNKGGGTLCLVINAADGSQIGLWNIPYIVEEVPGAGSAAAEQYYTAFSQAAEVIAVFPWKMDEYGCFYRDVVDELSEYITREYLNPPMVYNHIYRTTKRDSGMPVYVFRFLSDVVPTGIGDEADIPLPVPENIPGWDWSNIEGYRNFEHLYTTPWDIPRTLPWGHGSETEEGVINWYIGTPTLTRTLGAPYFEYICVGDVADIDARILTTIEFVQT